MALEGWRPSLGPQAFLSAAAAAADALAGMNVPADAPLLQGGPNHRGVNLIVGWNGADERLDIVANFATRPEANTAYETFRNRTGLAGLRQLVLLSEATLERQAHLPAGSSEALDYRENGALAERFASGMDPGVIAGITAWLALEYPTKPFPTHENCHHE